jgi:chromatin remodeling complex protein RSC6
MTRATKTKKATKAPKKSTRTSKKKKEVPAPMPVEEEEDEDELVEEDDDIVDDESVEEEEVVKKTKTKRKVPTRETVIEEFDSIIALVEAEIETLRSSTAKVKGIKFLRSLNKKVKSLKSQTSRVVKQKNKPKRKTNSNSGFLKPVPISKQMGKFTGFGNEELRSRVDITKYLCKYIAENDLQNPKDKREILADAKLRKLLDYDPKTAKNALTYFRMQTYMKPHFICKVPA